MQEYLLLESIIQIELFEHGSLKHALGSLQFLPVNPAFF
jgi:hypothetical protein